MIEQPKTINVSHFVIISLRPTSDFKSVDDSSINEILFFKYKFIEAIRHPLNTPAVVKMTQTSL